MNIKDMNIWKKEVKPIEGPNDKTESTRLSQFEDQGYRIKKYEADYIIIERLKSTRSVICSSIDEAEIIINLAISIEQDIDVNVSPNPSRYILDKAELLIGR